MSTTPCAIDAAGAPGAEIDTSNGTIYVFDPPPGAVHNAALDLGDLCYATYADDRIVDLGGGAARLDRQRVPRDARAVREVPRVLSGGAMKKIDRALETYGGCVRAQALRNLGTLRHAWLRPLISHPLRPRELTRRRSGDGRA